MLSTEEIERIRVHESAYQEELKKWQYEKNRIYYALNKEQEAVRTRFYRQENKEVYLERKYAYRKSNPDLIRQQQRAYRKVDPEKTKAADALHNAKAKPRRDAWYEKNKESQLLKSSQYAKEKPWLKAAAKAKRKSAKLRATPLWADLPQIKLIYLEAARMTRETGIRYEVDHIIPLQNSLVCGFHCAANLQVLTRTENRKKNNQFTVNV